MINSIWFLAAIVLVGNGSDRTILHFSSSNCPACRKIQPTIDQLNSEGWAIRSIDSARETATADKWRESLQEDQYVFSIGCDGWDEPTRRDTFITKLNRFLGPSNVEIAGAPVQGRSGGGLFDASGRLIGVCVTADNDLDEGMFVGPEATYALLEKNKLDRLVK